MSDKGFGHHQHLVLVVDDEPRVVETLKRLLEADGYLVQGASNSQEALDLVTRTVPCMVLTDVLMPGLDGYELCRRLKADPGTADVPVAMVTGRVDEADVQRGLEAGAVDYIKKPFDAAEVRMRVRSQIRVHEALNQARRAEQRYRLLFETSRDAIMTLAPPDFHFTSGNPATLAMFGARDEAHFTSLGPGDVSPEVQPCGRPSGEVAQEAIGQAMQTGSNFFEWTHRRVDGPSFPATVLLTRFELDGQPLLQATVRDITAQKQAEQANRQKERFISQLLDALPFGVLLIREADHRIVMVNKHASKLIGLPTDEITDKVCHHFVCPADEGRCPVSDLGLTIVNAEKILIDGQGEEIPVLKTASKVVLNDETYIMDCFVDIAERKALEAQLSHAQKLEAVGQLAAGIAHEINTPTQFVSDSVHFLSEAFDDLRGLISALTGIIESLEAPARDAAVARAEAAADEADLEYLDEHVPGSLERCLDGLSRIAKIVGAMKEFAHPDQAEKSPADLNQALLGTLTISKNEYKYVADAETELGELPPVACHVGELNQVFLNLIVNAAHAIEDVVGDSEQRGTIRIQTATDNGHAVIRISDTGCGIPDAVRDRIFDPFFTTKEVGRGSGQGLAIAHSVVVDKHCGELSCDSQEGQGTTFTIRLPLDGKGGCNQERDRA